MSSYFVHPSSFVDEPSSIGEGVKIWHFCHIMPHAVIGDHCILGQNVMVGSHVRLGRRVKVQNNVSLYEGVQLEEEVFIGPSVVFTNVINPRSAIERKHAFLPTLVKKGASIGANATIVCGVTIGAYAFIGAGAVVIRDVPSYAKLVGNPARQVGWVCECGNKLVFNESGHALCSQEQVAYHLEGNVVQKLGKLGPAEAPH